jgi:hypothetical protein
VRSFTLGLQDKDKNEAYFVSVGLGSGVGRGIANSVLNLKAFDNVQLGAYAQVNKETKKSYGAVAVRQGDGNTTVKWKYDPKAPNSELPAPREFVGKGNKIERDCTAQEEFLLAKLKEFATVVQEEAKKRRANAPAQTASNPTNDEPHVENETAPGEKSEGEDVPF